MWYLFVNKTTEGGDEARAALRDEHVQRIIALKKADKLFAAGPYYLDRSDVEPESVIAGSVVIAEFASLEAAKSWSAEDPYTKNGLYSHTEIKPFKNVF